MAELMSQLIDPEKGWKRISCADSNIVYSGDWYVENYVSGLNVGHWNNYSKYTYSTDAYLEFYFIGTKFRLITGSGYNKKENNNIDIDNESFIFSNYLKPPQARTVSFEKLDLGYNIHKVKIYSKVINASYNMQIEAFDIDENGRVLSKLEYENLSISNKLIKTSDKYIGKVEFGLDTSLLDIKNNIENSLISIKEINNKLNKEEINYKFNLLWFK